jgi:hypothetical protein
MLRKGASGQNGSLCSGRKLAAEAVFSADFRLKSKGKDYQSVNIWNS